MHLVTQLTPGTTPEVIASFMFGRWFELVLEMAPIRPFVCDKEYGAHETRVITAG